MKNIEALEVLFRNIGILSRNSTRDSFYRKALQLMK